MSDARFGKSRATHIGKCAVCDRSYDKGDWIAFDNWCSPPAKLCIPCADAEIAEGNGIFQKPKTKDEAPARNARASSRTVSEAVKITSSGDDQAANITRAQFDQLLRLMAELVSEIRDIKHLLANNHDAEPVQQEIPKPKLVEPRIEIPSSEDWPANLQDKEKRWCELLEILPTAAHDFIRRYAPGHPKFPSIESLVAGGPEAVKWMLANALFAEGLDPEWSPTNPFVRHSPKIEELVRLQVEFRESHRIAMELRDASKAKIMASIAARNGGTRTSSRSSNCVTTLSDAEIEEEERFMRSIKTEGENDTDEESA